MVQGTIELSFQVKRLIHYPSCLQMIVQFSDGINPILLDIDVDFSTDEDAETLATLYSVDGIYLASAGNAPSYVTIILDHPDFESEILNILTMQTSE